MLQHHSAGKPLFINQPVIDPFCSVLLFWEIFFLVLLQAFKDEGLDLVSDDGWIPMIVLSDIGMCFAFTVFPDGLSGNAECSGNPPDGLIFIVVSPN